MNHQELSDEIERLKQEFNGADPKKLNALDALIEQAAIERLFLKELNEQAFLSGLVQIHPENPHIQKTLPVSGEIAKHAASLTNIMDKLMKHLSVGSEDGEDDLGDYE